MSKESNLDKIKNLPEFTKQFGGLVIIILLVISSFFVLNIIIEFYKKYSDENCNNWRPRNRKNFNNQ